MTEPLTTILLDLFHGPLREVRFPDAGAERLGAAIDATAKASDALARAESAVEAARVALAETRRVVAQEAERTLAYVRIYAAERPDLLAAIEAATARAPSRRGPGRPRKARAIATGDKAGEGTLLLPTASAAE